MSINDIIAIYKPAGPSSNAVLERIRRITGVKKVGHAGTLDPLARGVLVVGIGTEATKKLKNIVTQKKKYCATIRLGISSATDDEEGDKTEYKITRIPSQEEILKVLNQFTGIISQVPPRYSAVKIHGKEAYKRARRGEIFELPPRKVEIKNIQLIDYRWPVLKIKVTAGPGVYIRALARDIGITLGTGGYLIDLERTRVGQFTNERAILLDHISRY